MGRLPNLEALHYPAPRLVFVDAAGRRRASLPYATFRKLLDGRHFDFMRGELES